MGSRCEDSKWKCLILGAKYGVWQYGIINDGHTSFIQDAQSGRGEMDVVRCVCVRMEHHVIQSVGHAHVLRVGLARTATYVSTDCDNS